jgi:hypothetical protein
MSNRGVLKEVLPLVGEAAERVVLAQPREDVCADAVGTSPLEIFDDREPNGTGAQLLYPDRLVIKLTIFSRVIP